MDLLDRLRELLEQNPLEVVDHGHHIEATSQALELPHALAHAYRTVVTTGAKPVSVFHGAQYGPNEELLAACDVLQLPYDSDFQTDADSVTVHAELDDPTRHTPVRLSHDGDLLYLLGPLPDDRDVDFKMERLIGDIMIAASRDGLLNGAHAVTEGGFLVALAQMAIIGEKGARFWIPDGVELQDALLSPAPSRVICVVPRSEELRFSDMCIARYVPLHRIGVVDADQIELQDHFTIPVAEL